MPAAQINTIDNYVAGRPAKYDIKKLTQNLNDWVRDTHNHDMLGWIEEYDVDPRLPSQWAANNEEFGEAWFKAKAKLAKRRNEMLCTGELPLPVWSRYQHNYDVLHAIENEALKDRDAARKKSVAESEKDSWLQAMREKCVESDQQHNP